MTSRRYIKRVWRVPKDRGALPYFSALVIKSLVKHGWPVRARLVDGEDAFFITHLDHGDNLLDDCLQAATIAVRIVARTYNLDVIQLENWVSFNRKYSVTSGGHFKELKP